MFSGKFVTDHVNKDIGTKFWVEESAMWDYTHSYIDVAFFYRIPVNPRAEHERMTGIQTKLSLKWDLEF